MAGIDVHFCHLCVRKCRQMRCRFTPLRLHAIAKITAVWLVVLIVLPFTAPFAVLDLGNPAQTHQVQNLSKGKPTEEKFAVAVDSSSSIASAGFVAIDFLGRPWPTHAIRLQRTILRI
jgi:hypothetical protein